MAGNDRTHVALPAGTVTFLLAAVERPGPGAQAARMTVAEAAEARGGIRPPSPGPDDGVLAAFARASDAVAAAVDAQRALADAAAPEPPPAVRIALHTAEAHLREDGDDFGAAIARAARLHAAATGGGIVVSRTTRDLSAERLPSGVHLVSGGDDRREDAGPPEQLFLVVGAGLPVPTPRARAAESVPHNLPASRTSFVGRDGDLRAIAGVLAATRLLTLTGTGGCGKTRLAACAAAQALPRFPAGAWWVDLAALTDDVQVGEAVASAVGVRPLPGQPPLAAAVAHLGSAPALVVLDNCEHLLAAAGAAAEALLTGCPRTTVLATSRAPLGLPEETDWRVPSLALPPRPRASAPISALAQSDAVRLFIERAAKVRPGFTVTNANAPAVAAICTVLDGIPLAIELAAARTRVMTPEEIAEGLGDALPLLAGRRTAALPRHQTLRACIDWSHDLLDARERVLLRRLGACEGGFGRDAATAVGTGDGLPAGDVLEILGALVEKSLVLAETDGSAVRYRMLETVRQYALERLVESGEETAVRDRHLDHYRTLVAALAPQLATGRQGEHFRRLDAEAANLAGALRHASRSDPVGGLRLACDLAVWWKLRGRVAEADAAYAVALGADAPPGLRAEGLWARAYLKTYAGDYAGCVETAQEALGTAKEAGATAIVARALDLLGTLQMMGDPAGALAILGRSRELARAAGDEACWIDATQIMGFALLYCERYDAAAAVLAEAREPIVRLGHHEFAAWDVVGRGAVGTVRLPSGALRAVYAELAAADGVTEPVTQHLAEASLVWVDAAAGRTEGTLARIAAVRRSAVAAGAGMALPWIDHAEAVAHLATGDLDGARAVLVRAADGFAGGDVFALLHVLPLLAEVARLQGDPDAAHAALAAAEDPLAGTGAPVRRAETRFAAARLRVDEAAWSDAEALVHAGLDDLLAAGARAHLPAALELLAEIASGLESPAEAARLLGAADAGRAALDRRRFPAYEERAAAVRAAAVAALGAEEATRAGAEGAALDLEEAVAWARRARGSRRRPSAGWESLTPTERRVAELAAEGLTNPQIAERMFIARGTVKIHLSHAYAKLGTRNRSELTALVVRRAAAASGA